MFKSILKISLVIFLLFISVTVLLYWQTNAVSDFVKDILNSNLEGIAEIRYDRLSGNLFETIDIENLTITLDDSSRIYTNNLKIEYNLTSIILKPYLLRSIVFDSLSINLKIKPKEKQEIPQQKIKLDTFSVKLDSLLNFKEYMAILPELIIEDMTIEKGKLTIPANNISIDNLKLKTSYSYVSDELNFSISKISGIWKEKDFILDHMQFEIKAKSESVTLNKFQVETNKSHLYATSEINYDESTWIIFNLEDFYIDFSEVFPHLNIQEMKEGWTKGKISVVGSPQKFSARIFALGNSGNYELDSLVIDADYNDNTLFIRKGKVLVNNSLLTFTGIGSQKYSRGQIYYNKFDVQNFVPQTINTSLSGNISFNMEKLDFTNLSGNVNLLLHDSVIDSVKIDTLKFALLAENSNFKIVEPSFLKFADSSVFSVRGSLDKNMNINAGLFTNRNNLEQLFTALNFQPLKGIFDANLTLTGNVENPDMIGYLFLPKFKYDQFVLDTILLELNLKKIFTSRRGSAQFSINEGDLGGFELTEAVVKTKFDSNKVLFDELKFSNKDNYVSLAGKVVQKADTFYLGLNQLRIFYQNYWVENSDSLLINLYPDEFVINQAHFHAPGNGILECRGFWDNNLKDLQLGLYVENLRLDPFTQFVDSSNSFGGVINGEVLLLDPFSQPDIESQVNGNLLTFKNASLGNVSVNAEYDNGKIYFKEFQLKNGNNLINASGDIALKFVDIDGKKTIDFVEGTKSDLSLRWENIDLNRYRELLNLTTPVKGLSSGELSLAGSLKTPEITLTVKSENLSFKKLNISDLQFAGHYKDDYVFIDSLKSEVNNTYFWVQGKQNLPIDFTNLNFDFENSPFELTVKSNDDRIEFLGNFLDQVEKITGNYEAQIQVQGTPAKPVLSDGFFRIEDGEIELSRVKDPVVDIFMEAVIQDSVMRIEKLSGFSIKEKDILEEAWSYATKLFRFIKGETEPEGQFSGNGTIELTNVLHPKINLNVAMNDFYVNYFVENTELLVSSKNLSISGKDTINLSGDITIGKGIYIVDLDKMRKKVYLTATELKQERAIAWNLNINIPENFIIASSPLDLVNNFELEISGELNAVQEPNSPEMGLTGNVEILSGTYRAFGQKFEIQQGAINFTNPQKINPEIEIYAEKETNNYVVELTVNGNLDRLEQDLQIRDINGTYLTNLSMFDKLGYLSGISSSENGSGLVNTGQDVIDTSVETVLERGAKSVTGLDKVEISNSQSVIDLQSMRLNNGLRDASISIGKYLTSNLYLEYRSQFGSGAIPTPKLSWDAGNQLSLAYKINKQWTVESAYAQTLKGNTLINISLGWKTSF